MISTLSLKNFKCFRSIVFKLGGINLFAGVNGTGKSTVLQSLLLVRQSFESESLRRGDLQLNGALADLGTAGEVFCAAPNSDFIEVALTNEAKSELHFTARYSEEASKEYSLYLEQPTGFDGEGRGFGIFSELFNYLQAERTGPRKTFQILPEGRHSFHVGRAGESAAYVVASPHRDAKIANEALLLSSEDGQELATIRYQWPLWMARLFPGFDAQSEIYSTADQVRLAFALQETEAGQSLFVRPGNTGFGISYALGIIVAGLAAEHDTVLLVENPEAHLHPRAQSLIGEFLARVSAGGAQVFVETHSEHVLNGVRRMVKQQIIPPDKCRLFFFSRTAGDLEPTKTDVPISGSGEIEIWPEGFFDQLDKDLTEILS
ncbi:MAG: hypothetical protein DLM73_05765 [Chthoniobacterales bacterium]|nr:MAG: hypothetical protein DLM73_05765 [Chthoniobacterales bacterium]